MKTNQLTAILCSAFLLVALILAFPSIESAIRQANAPDPVAPTFVGCTVVPEGEIPFCM